MAVNTVYDNRVVESVANDFTYYCYQYSFFNDD